MLYHINYTAYSVASSYQVIADWLIQMWFVNASVVCLQSKNGHINIHVLPSSPGVLWLFLLRGRWWNILVCLWVTASGHATNRRLIRCDTVIRPRDHQRGGCLGLDVTEWPRVLPVVHLIRERVIFGDCQREPVTLVQISSNWVVSARVVVTLDGMDVCLRGREKYNDLITS